MQRKIVTIDEAKCTGCGLCVNACQEGALKLVDGKAKLISDSYCDGLGACLPECPAGAIKIEEREAGAFSEDTAPIQTETEKHKDVKPLACGCPGTQARTIERKQDTHNAEETKASAPVNSQLRQWPCQIKLVPVNAPYFDNANLLIAADCTAYAYANIHNDFIKGRITLIGCPKLDNINYAEKFTEILKAHNIKSITVLRMEVPCCGGIENAVKQAILNSGKMMPWRVIVIGTDGSIIED